MNLPSLILTGVFLFTSVKVLQYTVESYQGKASIETKPMPTGGLTNFRPVIPSLPSIRLSGSDSVPTLPSIP